MSKRVLITGTSGFIGANALEYYLEKTDWNFILPNSWKHKGSPERLVTVFAKNPEWIKRCTLITHDLVSPFTEQTIQRMSRIDYIINFASESHVDRSIEEPVAFFKNNVDLALTMIELAKIVKPEYFFHISTDEVYGTAPEGVKFKEWSPILPSNPYAGSKAAQEAAMIESWRTYKIPLILTNTVNNFGEMQDKEKFLARLVSKISKGEKVTVHGNSGYIGGRFYLYVKNHADAILFLINNTKPTMYEEGRMYPDRYNVTSEDELNNLEMAHLVSDLMGKELNYELVDYHAVRPGHDRRYALDGSKLKELGWNMPFTLGDSLKNYINWTLKNDLWM